MIESATSQSRHDIELDAYNAAFHELGFRWHWDSDTYGALFADVLADDSADKAADGSNATAKIRQYLETRQAHLLKAYDADFLVGVIQEKHALHRSRGAANAKQRRFDWAETLGGELGA